MNFKACLCLNLEKDIHRQPIPAETWSPFKAGLRRFCDKVVPRLWTPAPFPCLQTSRSLNNENYKSAAQDITVNL